MAYCLPQRFSPWFVLAALYYSGHAKPPGKHPNNTAGNSLGIKTGNRCFTSLFSDPAGRYTSSSAGALHLFTVLTSRAVTANIIQNTLLDAQKPVWVWSSPGFGLEPPVLAFGSCSMHRSQCMTVRVEILTVYICTVLVVLHWQYLRFCNVPKPHTHA